MLRGKRITLLCGHYGSGKTSIAINLALALRKTAEQVALADLDIVNPYFRSKDRQRELEQAGIRFICSPYANSNVDIPALPQEMYAITHDRTQTAILDIGGDDRGALALGRLAPAIREENDYEMLLVVNCFRPLTRDAASTIEIMREIEYAAGIPFTGIVNNSNLGSETTDEVILSSAAYAQEISSQTGLPILLTTVADSWYDKVVEKLSNVFPIQLPSSLLTEGQVEKKEC